MILINYLVKTIVISGVLFGYYSLFLKNRRFHSYNRIFLLAGALISMTIPLLKLKMPGFLNSPSGDSPISLLGVGPGSFDETVAVYAQNRFWQDIGWEFIFVAIILFGILILTVRFFKSLVYIKNIRRDNSFELLSEARLYMTFEKGTPFSFFNNIFWDKKIDLNSKAGSQILLHELYHVKSKHSLDILFLEISCILYWFNPFFHLIRRELKAVHEYGADAYATGSFDAYDYANLLLLNASGTSKSITHPFFNNQIKRRIAMITRNKSMKRYISNRLLILPILTLLVCLFGFQTEKPGRASFGNEAPVRVVVDAGHGGDYAGGTFQNVQEKNINLSISKKISELAKNYNIEIIMSRENDETPGSTDLGKSLEYIASLAEKNHASLFISIHTNQLADKGDNFQNTQSGFEIYVPRPANSVYNNSVKLASSITASIKPDYTIAPELKQRQTGVFILDKATVPAVLIECGYIDNAMDLKYLQDEKNQEKIARDILEGIRKYSDQTTFQPVIKNQTSDSLVIDQTLTYEELKKIDPNTIQSIEVNKGKGRILVKYKNGKNAMVIMNDDNRSKSDTLVIYH